VPWSTISKRRRFQQSFKPFLVLSCHSDNGKLMSQATCIRSFVNNTIILRHLLGNSTAGIEISTMLWSGISLSITWLITVLARLMGQYCFARWRLSSS